MCTRVVTKIFFGLRNAEIYISKILTKISQVQTTGVQIDFNDHFVAHFMNPFYGRFDLKYQQMNKKHMISQMEEV